MSQVGEHSVNFCKSRLHLVGEAISAEDEGHSRAVATGVRTVVWHTEHIEDIRLLAFTLLGTHGFGKH